VDSGKVILDRQYTEIDDPD